MRVRLGDPRCVLVVAPHADDETIGAYILMARLRRRGVPVHVVVVTDGAASHPASRAWPRARLICERQRETRREVRRIRIAADHVAFLGLPDGALPALPGAVRREIAATVRHMPKPLLIVAPAATDDHPDHRVVAAAVSAARMGRTRHLAYPVWPAGAQLYRSRTLPLTSQERLAKRHAIRRYFTQAGRITDDPSGFAMTRAQIAAFSRPVETFLEMRR